MVILIALFILCMPYVVTKLRGAQRASTSSPAQPPMAPAGPPIGAKTSTGNREAPVWTALDDRQLTRLLTESTPRTATE